MEINEHREELQQLRDEMAEANQQLEQNQSRSVDTLSDLVDNESRVRDQENKDLLQRIQDLVEANVRQQEQRIRVIGKIPVQLRSAGQTHSTAGASFASGSQQLAERLKGFSDRLIKTSETMKTRIQSDCAVSCPPSIKRH
jgi:uncharacterized protein (DUF885 family)